MWAPLKLIQCSHYEKAAHLNPMFGLLSFYFLRTVNIKLWGPSLKHTRFWGTCKPIYPHHNKYTGKSDTWIRKQIRVLRNPDAWKLLWNEEKCISQDKQKTLNKVLKARIQSSLRAITDTKYFFPSSQIWEMWNKLYMKQLL